MLRKIIKIDETLCDGCGLCVSACHEGAIGIKQGKAHVLRDDYCDGLGDCLPVCPTNAIAFEERDTLAYDEVAVKANMAKKQHATSGCAGSQVTTFSPHVITSTSLIETPSQLRQWPVQIQLMPIQAPYYDQADLLIAADCCAYAYANFHQVFMNDRVTLIGCPKLDACSYADKLRDIIRMNDIHSITVIRMQVPCCGGMVRAVEEAIKRSGKSFDLDVITITTNGHQLDETAYVRTK